MRTAGPHRTLRPGKQADLILLRADALNMFQMNNAA